MRASLGLAAAAIALTGSLCACSSLDTGMKSALEPDYACNAGASNAQSLNPKEAVARVATNPGHCQSGTFALTVRSTYHAGSVMYLNSSMDPAAADNLAVAVLPRARAQLAADLGGLPERLLLNQTITVTGTARRVAIPYSLARGFGSSPGNALVGVSGDFSSGWSPAFAGGAGPTRALGVSVESHVLVDSARNLALVDVR
jgi:hypothetical protein